MHVPAHIQKICQIFNDHNYQAFLVGGAVRDALLGHVPKDWDLATDATPKQVQDLFDHVVPTGLRYGTVSIIWEDQLPVEVTTFRQDGRYTDGRHPDSVTFQRTIRDDLGRRDLTINAIAYDPLTQQYVDPYHGRSDIESKRLCIVGDPVLRLQEDPLRILRLLRFYATLVNTSGGDNKPWTIIPSTKQACEQCAPLLRHIAPERIRNELDYLLVGRWAADALKLAHTLDILPYFLPELSRCNGVPQNKHHIHDVFEHILLTVDTIAPDRNLRLAALLHDIAKPDCLTTDERGNHFFDHDVLGAKQAREIMTRLCYPTDRIDEVVPLVQSHMFMYRTMPGGPTDKTVRKLIAKIGRERIYALLELRRADAYRPGGPTNPVADLFEHVMRIMHEEPKAPTSMRHLALSGDDVMRLLDIPQGKMVGYALEYLFNCTLEDPTNNNSEKLTELLQAWWQRRCLRGA